MAWRHTVGDTTVERFVPVLVLGGLALVAGLWVLALVPAGSSLRLAGWVLAVGGGLGVAIGTVAGLDVGPPG